ncbi:MDR family MFS transporter [Gordonia terrae]|uniref:Drug resistance transporter n=1 Tax=Gordonia terrae NBRC 100016 TaxID=1089454 RepID=A0ABQ0HEA8_9ACTN|nr:MDR family MFS transporter [Gordonia terrae]ANY25610.1 MFS transporter [Gordonia terrae]GAB44196.1 putative drug resistance transporter [Gordonia terrae NBRC 100016]VTR08571.1 drug resistance transporter, EmrB/QacA subfamily [Clostridioides difficile]VTS64118.1 Multidrug resistance protein B [Gordonia terrae]
MTENAALQGAGNRSATGTDRSPVLLIGVLLVAAFVVILNETILSVALPTLMTDLDITAATAQWLTSGFLLTMAIVIPITGYLMQRFTLRSIYIAAMSLFTIGTLVAALAPGFELLIVARVVQASGTALMVPLLMTTILNVVPEQNRGRTMGLVSIVIAVAPAVGPTVSGLILQSLSWRAMFWIVLPIAIGALILGGVFVRNVTERRPAQLDIISVPLSALGFGGIVYGLSSIGESAGGHAPIPPWVPLLVGAVALALFVVRQLTLADRGLALLDLRTFAIAPFRLAVVLMAGFMLTLFGALILLPLYLQNVMGKDVLTTGLVLLPGGLVMGLLAPFVGALFDKVGARPLVLPGTVAVSAGTWLLTTLDAGSSLGMVIAAHVILSAGIAFGLTPLMTSALGSLSPELYSHGSATVSTIQQVAGAAGTALFITLMSRGTQSAIDDGVNPLQAGADGIHLAFVVAACLSLVLIAAAALVRGRTGAPKTAVPEPV